MRALCVCVFVCQRMNIRPQFKAQKRAFACDFECAVWVIIDHMASGLVSWQRSLAGYAQRFANKQATLLLNWI